MNFNPERGEDPLNMDVVYTTPIFRQQPQIGDLEEAAQNFRPAAEARHPFSWMEKDFDRLYIVEPTPRDIE